MTRDDESIRHALSTLKAADQRATPPFSPMWAAAARRRSASAPRVVVATGALAAAAAFVIWVQSANEASAPSAAPAGVAERAPAPPPVSSPTAVAPVPARRVALAPPDLTPLDFLLDAPPAALAASFADPSASHLGTFR